MRDYRKIKDEEWVRRGDVHTMLVDLPPNATMTEVIWRLHDIPAVPHEEWISVKDRLPDKEGWYIVWYGRENRSYASDSVFSPRHQCWNCFDSFTEEMAEVSRAETINRTVTHWMPMPPAPEERSDDE